MTTIIETYLNSLPNDILTLNVNMSLDNCITELPDLTRFQNLQSFNCHNTQITSLPNLPKSLKILYCVKNKLTSLPDLSDFHHLEILNCSNNDLTSLPSLPENLKTIYCPFNKLTSLPNLTCIIHLETLHCYNNDLTSLPSLPLNLKIVRCFNTPINTIVGSHSVFSHSVFQLKQNVQIVNNLRHLYYCLKFKKQFRKWLWEKVREPNIMRIYNPLYLVENLNDDDDLDTVLDNWK